MTMRYLMLFLPVLKIRNRARAIRGEPVAVTPPKAADA